MPSEWIKQSLLDQAEEVLKELEEILSKADHVKYAESEMEYFPEHWDDQTRSLVRFMILEAFQAGRKARSEIATSEKSDLNYLEGFSFLLNSVNNK